eukprot:scaffold17477_cov41-Cyclotella_meneghiniana.AAC.8
MKPDWDKLMEQFKGSATQLVADVDCTADGKPLCDEVGVRGYPTIKYPLHSSHTLRSFAVHSNFNLQGDPADLQDYQGGRDFDSLSKFAADLKPMCSPKNIDLCDDAKKAEISKFQSMAAAELDKLIEAEEKKLEEAEEEFKEEVQKLQDRYTALSTEKDEKIKAVKDAGLGLMKAVKASGKPAKDEL